MCSNGLVVCQCLRQSNIKHIGAFLSWKMGGCDSQFENGDIHLLQNLISHTNGESNPLAQWVHNRESDAIESLKSYLTILWYESFFRHWSKYPSIVARTTNLAKFFPSKGLRISTLMAVAYKTVMTAKGEWNKFHTIILCFMHLEKYWLKTSQVLMKHSMINFKHYSENRSMVRIVREKWWNVKA